MTSNAPRLLGPGAIANPGLLNRLTSVLAFHESIDAAYLARMIVPAISHQERTVLVLHVTGDPRDAIDDCTRTARNLGHRDLQAIPLYDGDALLCDVQRAIDPFYPG
jgi:hypothetical protein